MAAKEAGGLTTVRRSPLKRKTGMPPRRERMRPGTHPLRRFGKKGKLNRKMVRLQKKDFEAWEITTCEARLPGCTYDDQLGFAHTKKRRHLTPDELRHAVVLLCANCHWSFERRGEAKMQKALQQLIRSRVTPKATEYAAA